MKKSFICVRIKFIFISMAFRTKPRVETDASGNSEMVYWFFYLFLLVRVLNTYIFFQIRVFDISTSLRFLNFNKKGNKFSVVVKQMMSY